MKVDIDRSEAERLADLVNEYRDAVASNEISGYGQSKDDELVDLDQLLAKLRLAR
jgi:hypothetical protein